MFIAVSSLLFCTFKWKLNKCHLVSWSFTSARVLSLNTVFSFLFQVKDPGTRRLQHQVRGQRGQQHEAETKRDRYLRSTGCWTRPTKVLDGPVRTYLPCPTVNKEEKRLTFCLSAKVDPNTSGHWDASITSLTNIHWAYFGRRLVNYHSPVCTLVFCSSSVINITESTCTEISYDIDRVCHTSLPMLTSRSLDYMFTSEVKCWGV